MMYETRHVYAVGYWLPYIRTDTSIQLGGTVPERTRNSDTVCSFSRGTSPELSEEAKSIRERYILVAVIDIMIIDGVRNMRLVGSVWLAGFEFNQYPPLIDWRNYHLNPNT